MLYFLKEKNKCVSLYVCVCVSEWESSKIFNIRILSWRSTYSAHEIRKTKKKLSNKQLNFSENYSISQATHRHNEIVFVTLYTYIDAVHAQRFLQSVPFDVCCLFLSLSLTSSLTLFVGCFSFHSFYKIRVESIENGAKVKEENKINKIQSEVVNHCGREMAQKTI